MTRDEQRKAEDIEQISINNCVRDGLVPNVAVMHEGRLVARFQLPERLKQAERDYAAFLELAGRKS